MPAETSLLGNQAFYAGVQLPDIFFGIELYLYLKTMHIFLTRRKARRKSDVVYAVFSTVMLTAITVWMAINAVFGQTSWLQNQEFGDTSRWFTNWQGRDIALTMVITIQLMTDGLMMYRCRIVCDSFGVIIIPFILWLTTLALGILLLRLTSTAQVDLFDGSAAKVGLAYCAVSVFLTATLTCMICYRLVFHARAMKKYVGEEHAAPYFGIVILLVESVLPLTLSGIAYLVSYGLGSGAEGGLGPVYTAVMGVSPQLLILRVAQGNAWQGEKTRAALSTLRFSEGRGNTTGSSTFDETVP